MEDGEWSGLGMSAGWIGCARQDWGWSVGTVGMLGVIEDWDHGWNDEGWFRFYWAIMELLEFFICFSSSESSTENGLRGW